MQTIRNERQNDPADLRLVGVLLRENGSNSDDGDDSSEDDDDSRHDSESDWSDWPDYSREGDDDGWYTTDEEGENNLVEIVCR
jgi:hypothetical protein